MSLFYLLRKIWTLRSVQYAKREGFYYELDHGLLENMSDTEAVGEYNLTVLDVPEAKFVPADSQPNEITLNEIDEYNDMILNELIAKHSRLKVILHYKCEVKPPPISYSSMTPCQRRNSDEYLVKGERLLRHGSHSLLRPTCEYVYDMSRVLQKWPYAQVEPHILNTLPLPPQPAERYACKKKISLHKIALNTLVEFTRAGSPEDLLRAHKNTIRAVHVFALALSGVPRNAIGEPESEVEYTARGQTVADVAPTGMVSLLFPSSISSPGKRDKWTEDEENKYFCISNDVYVYEELLRRSENGTWSPVPEERRTSRNGGTASRRHTMDFFVFNCL